MSSFTETWNHLPLANGLRLVNAAYPKSNYSLESLPDPLKEYVVLISMYLEVTTNRLLYSATVGKMTPRVSAKFADLLDSISSRFRSSLTKTKRGLRTGRLK